MIGAERMENFELICMIMKFVVGTKDGHIRTAFKPKDKMDYWGDEIERNR